MIADSYALHLDEHAPPGEYLIEIGMYEPTSGQRLPVSGANADPGAQRIVVGEVVVP